MLSSSAICRIASVLKLNTTYFILKNPNKLVIPKEVEFDDSLWEATFEPISSIVNAIAELNGLETSATEQVAEWVFESSLYDPSNESFVKITLGVK